MTGRSAMLAALPLALGALAPQGPKPTAPPPGAAFLKANCVSCHNAADPQGKLDLTALRFDVDDPKAFGLWVKVHDRVRDGEMPPAGAGTVDTAARQAFLKAIAAPMVAADDARARREGRSVWRRLNRDEYENTVRDLLGAPWLGLKEQLPEDGEANLFNKDGRALDISHVHMARYLGAAEYALREALAPRATQPETTVRRYYTRQMGSFVGPATFDNFNSAPERATFPILGNAADRPVLEGKAPMTVGEGSPIQREFEAMGVVASAYEPLEPKFDRFRAPAAGKYRLKLSAYTFWSGPESERRWWRPSRMAISVGRTTEPITLYSESPPRQLRRLASFDVGPETEEGASEPVTVEVWLRKGETVRPDAVRLFRSRPPGWRNPLAQKDGQPGVAFRWLEVEGPLPDAAQTTGQNLLFGDLPVGRNGDGAIVVESQNPDADARKLLAGFLARAYRRPLEPDAAQPYLALYRAQRDSGRNFTEAMLAAYTAVLCSPEFLTLEERPGRLDDFALAGRLSYLLWNTEPDAELRAMAAKRALNKPGVLRSQAKRLLADPRSGRFVAAFLDYWLDLRKVGIVSPDEVLYNDYYLDDFLVESSVDETRAFFAELLTNNLPARTLVDTNFVTVNQRLAELYGLPGVQGAAIRRVELPADSVRGGLLTQASVLKVTANGTMTSPVVRGAWINTRILGTPPPPPPAAVPAVEPDTRGATTIREQLARHRSDPACSACHQKIDPAGFALESFDVFGGWRDRYRALGGTAPRVEGRGKNGLAFEFCLVQPVDPSGQLPDGRRFADVRELKKLLAANDRPLARNLVRQWVAYGTGAPVRFGDRPKIEAILDRARPTGYGVQSLLLDFVESDLFRSK